MADVFKVVAQDMVDRMNNKEDINMKELKYLVMYKNRTVAAFCRRWEAEKFIETSKTHNYELVITD